MLAPEWTPANTFSTHLLKDLREFFQISHNLLNVTERKIRIETLHENPENNE